MSRWNWLSRHTGSPLRGNLHGSLDVSIDQIEQMVANKAAALVYLHPSDFLKLTTLDDASRDSIIAESKSLIEYNAFTHARASIIPPHLDVEIKGKDAGKILGHEGRHRAAAVLKSGGTRMPVFLIPKVNGYSVRTVPDPSSRWGRPVEPRDFPLFLRAQFRPRVRVNLTDIQPMPERGL